MGLAMTAAIQTAATHGWTDNSSTAILQTAGRKHGTDMRLLTKICACKKEVSSQKEHACDVVWTYRGKYSILADR